MGVNHSKASGPCRAALQTAPWGAQEWLPAPTDDCSVLSTPREAGVLGSFLKEVPPE